MRRCLHDDALIETVASDWQPVSADEAVEAIRTALERDPYYLEGTWHYDPLPAGIVLTAMPVRERSTAGGIRHRTVWRLTSGRDGLIWRQRLFAGRDEALAHLEQHGPSLGLTADWASTGIAGKGSGARVVPLGLGDALEAKGDDVSSRSPGHRSIEVYDDPRNVAGEVAREADPR